MSMKVLLLTDYFYPFTPGGAEWSVYELAKSLKKRGIQPVVVTLNYGAESEELYDGLKIVRIPFFKKLTQLRKVVNPIWQNNPLFFITSAYYLIKVIQKEKPDLLHIHGKFLIPGAVIAGFITRKPVVVTIRDKQILCSYGKCFFEKGRYKACDWREYLTVDLGWYYQNYVKDKNIIKLLYTFISAVWTRLSFKMIALFAKRADAITAISQSQKKYLMKNGFKHVITIYNVAQFSQPKIISSDVKSILFVGKLSLGKGGVELIAAIPKVLKKMKVKFIFAGSVDLKEQIKDKMRNKIFKENTRFLGPVPHQKLTDLYKKSSVIVMPSIYPEAFGRVALEAISQGTPVIVSNRGALPEIIEDKKPGRIIEVTSNTLAKAIIDVVNHENIYRKNIKESYQKLVNKFNKEPVEKHLKLYQKLTK